MKPNRVGLLITLLAVVAVLGVGAAGTSMFGALIGIEIHELAKVEALSLSVTTHTSETLPTETLGTVYTHGKDLTVKFMISNSSAELSPYFEYITVVVRLEGGSWSGETSTAFSEGFGATTGSIEVSPDYESYALHVTVTYSSKDKPGTADIGLSIWAEG